MADIEMLPTLWKDTSRRWVWWECATITYKKEGGVNELYL